jgi:hypothetical protein
MQWSIDGPGQFRSCGQTTYELPPGAYSCFLDNCGNAIMQQRSLQIDELIDFPGSLPSQILEEIERFWDLGDRFARYGFLHRRGFLLYGKQGCGKSSLIHQVVSSVIDKGNVAFFCTWPNAFIAAVTKFRQVEPDRPIVCVFEDIEAIIQDSGDSELLQWLDGNHQVNKAINLASTNYPENLDRRIIARPRRFDRIIKIDAPDARMRDAYFARKLPELSESDRERWVEASNGLPFAALAELVISVCCLGYELDAAAARLRELDSHHPSSGEYAPEETPALPF